MKILGLIIIFFSCSAMGFIKSFEYTKALGELYAFILLIRFIKREIGMYLTKQKDIFYRFENPILEETGFLKTLRETELTDEKSVLFHALQIYNEKLRINEYAKSVLCEFAEDFGRMSPEEQTERCNSTLSCLEEIYKKEKEESTSRIKSCRSLWCMAGASAVLLLI